MSTGFFCELTPTISGNSVPVQFRQVCNFYFEEKEEGLYKIFGISALGLQKEGTASLHSSDVGETIQGSFVEEGKEILFEISPLNTFDTGLFFGGGVWEEKNIGGDVRQKYNITIWDARASKIDGDFLKLAFQKVNKLEVLIEKNHKKVSEQEKGFSQLSSEMIQAQKSVQEITSQRETINQNSAQIKSLLDEAKKLRSSLGEEQGEVDSLRAQHANLIKGNKDLSEQLKTTSLEAERVKDQADESLSSVVSVSLARAFKQRKEEARDLRKVYDRTFVAALVAAMLVSVFIFDSYQNLDAGAIGYLEYFFVRLPFIGIPIWLGVYASKKSSLSTRIEEFYAQKQALAESYEGYKGEISKIQTENSEELSELMKMNLSSISKDSSSFMDGSLKQSYSPVESIMGSFLPSQCKKVDQKTKSDG